MNAGKSIEPYDVVIIGSGQTGGSITQKLKSQKRRLALISLPESPEDLYDRTCYGLTYGHALPPSARVAYDGVDQFKGQPQFVNQNTLHLNNRFIKGKAFVLATGALPLVPPLTGLLNSSYLLPTDCFDLDTFPSSIIILGGGPSGVILAEKFLAQGTRVCLLTRSPRLLKAEEEEISSLKAQDLESRGATLHVQSFPQEVKMKKGKPFLTFKKNEETQEVGADKLVVACGFIPNTLNLSLERAHVYLTPTGHLVTNDEMRTSSPLVWAAGSVTGEPFSLARQDRQREIVTHNVCAPFFSRQKVDMDPFPLSIPTHPPHARIGLGEKEAQRQYRDLIVTNHHLKEHPGGLIKLIGRKKGGLLLGAHLLSPHAAEMILFFDLAIRAGLTLAELTERSHYPRWTRAEELYTAIQTWLDKS